jgi:hypothetical protein
MRLLDLVEQDHLVGPAPYRFGQHAALVVADIARRRADQAADGMSMRTIACSSSNSLGELGLADAGGPQDRNEPSCAIL